VAEFGGWIKLNGKSYVIDLQSYKVQDMPDGGSRLIVLLKHPGKITYNSVYTDHRIVFDIQKQ